MKEIKKLIDHVIAKPGRRSPSRTTTRIGPDRSRTSSRPKDCSRKACSGWPSIRTSCTRRTATQLLIIFQAMDAAGKDGTIRHVMSGINPQGCQVFSFKAPSAEERDHDYLWRSSKALPERGRIGIHNRSYYEEVLVVPRPSRASRCAEPARRMQGQGRLEATLPRDQQLREVPRRQRHRDPEVLPERLQGGTEAPLPGAHRSRREELEVLGQRRAGTRASGTTT